ncbi:hypothetical protein C8F01DRAFT_1266692 [Mycena amicta]|nr:hypothetical protein C8F01DRAFT_1266692 [Mycena amicta]
MAVRSTAFVCVSSLRPIPWAYQTEHVEESVGSMRGLATRTLCRVVTCTGVEYQPADVRVTNLQIGNGCRLPTRTAGAGQLQAAYASYGDRFQVVKIADIAKDQFPEALVAVDLATPMPGKVGFEEQLKGAVRQKILALR